MLLEYNVDTKEEAVGATAVEVRRRVAQRRLKQSASSGAVDADLLLTMKERNRDERKTQMHDNFEVTVAGVRERIAVGRAEQQLLIEGKVRALGRDLNRSTRQGKSRIELLTDLEERIIAMRAKLQDPTPVLVEDQLAAEVRSNNRQIHNRKFSECAVCGRKILVHLLPQHLSNCQLREATGERAPVFDVEQDRITSIATFAPHPPRNCRAINRGSSFIEWAWDPPVMDGGLPVTDYELSFDARVVEFDSVAEKYKKWTEVQPSQRTSRWGLKQPVHHHGYRLIGLRGGTEYCNFRIRCCNLRGWSEWVDMLPDRIGKQQQVMQHGVEIVRAKSIFTADPEAPSPPLYFECADVTSSCMRLRWQAPFYDGGSEVTDYIVYYTVLERHTTVTARNVIQERALKLKVPRIGRKISRHYSVAAADTGSVFSSSLISGGESLDKLTFAKSSMTSLGVDTSAPLVTSVVIRNLPSDTDITSISVQAVNKVKLLSQKMILKQKVRTREASRYTQLSRELARAAAHSEEWIDTSFFMNIQQRLLRVELMRKLQEELSVTPPDPLELKEAKQWAAIQEVEKSKRQREEAEALAAILEAQRLSESRENLDGMILDGMDDEMSQGSLVGSIASRYTHKLNPKEGNSAQKYMFTFRQRRQHFKRKLEMLDQTIKELTEEKYNIDKNRTILTLGMREMEGKHMVFKLEIERLKQYRGENITSSILHGSNMQYKTADYKRRINNAYEECIRDITNAKFCMIEGEDRRHQIRELLEKKEEEKKERQAKFLEFDLAFQRKAKLMHRIGAVSGNDDMDGSIMRELWIQTCTHYFNRLKEHMLGRQNQRQRVTDLFLKVILRKKQSAFSKWALGDFHRDSSDTAYFPSVGSVMLQQSVEKRVELQGLLREVIASTTAVKQKLKLVALTHTAKEKMISAPEFKLTEEGLDHIKLHSQGMHYLYEGDGYAMESKFPLALQMYETQVLFLRSRPTIDIKLLALCHGRLGKMFLQMDKHNRAIVEFDRQLSLAKEVDDRAEEADAYHGLGTGYLRIFDYDNAIRYLNIAQALWAAVGNMPRYSGALRMLYDCFDRLNNTDNMKIFREKIQAVEDNLRGRVSSMHEQLDSMKARLVSTAAEIEHVVNIERITFRALSLRQTYKKRTEELHQLEEEHEEQAAEVEASENILDAIQKEMEEALNSDEPEMWSALVHDQPQVVEIEELKTRLKQRSVIEVNNLKDKKETLNKISVKIKNAEDDLNNYDEELTLEDGPLMRHGRKDKPFRCISFCAANAAGNEVTGTASGGFEEFVAAEGSNIHFLDYHNGSLSHVILGDDRSIIRENKQGHTGVVTCLLHDGNLIFSGSVDETICCWQTQTYDLLRVLVGHEGTVVSLASEGMLLVSGSADATMRLWNKLSGEQVRVVYGHSKSVLSAEIGGDWMLTGSADHEVRVWKLEHKSKHTTVAECTFRLIGHETAVTCVKYGKTEVLSGDVLGRIFIWWMKTGRVLRKCQVHKGPVKCMQFDALHIVSGGVDCCVCITDVATGEVLQSLRGHTGHVLAVAFDSERIISASGDNTVRYWTWGKKEGPKDKSHVLDKGETLLTVSKLHKVPVDTLMRWNGILDMRQVHLGMKLIVKKGDPNVPTEAEKFAAERELRLSRGRTYAAKKLKESTINTGILSKYDRVHKMATDIDFFSMGNRMFGRQKRQIELFPDSTDPNQDNKSLAARIMRNDASAPEHAKKVLQRYFLTAGNEDEWGDIADQVGEAMLAIMIEYEVYSLVMEQKRALRDGRSIIGRINAHQKWLADTSPDKKPLSFMPTSYDATMDTDLASDEHTVNTEEQNRRDNEKRIALAEASKAAALLKQEEEEKEKQRRKQELREQSRRAEEAKERRKREKSAGNITTAQPVPPPRSSPTNRIILRNSSSLLQHGSSRELKAGSRGFDDGGLISDADNSVISGSSQSPKRSVQQNKVVGSSGKSETAESLVRSAATATISGSTLPSVNNTVRTPQNISRDSSWLGRRSDSPKRSTRPISPFLSTSLKRGIIAARPLNSVDNEIGNSHSNSNSMRALSRSPSHSERLRTDSQNSPYRRRVDTALAPVIDQQKAALALAAMPDFPGLSAPCQIDDSNSVEGYDSLESKSIGSGNRILVPVQRASSNASSKSGVGLGAHSDSQKREDGSRMRESRAEHSDASGSEKLPKSKSSRLPSL